VIDPADLLLSSYDFPLAQERIAQRPLEPRHAARLLAVEPGEGARHLTVWDLQGELQSGDLLVVNDTRVLRARLAARRASGGAVELLVLEPRGGGEWLCLARPAKRLKRGEWLTVEAPHEPPLRLQVLDADPETGGRTIAFPPECEDAAGLEPLLVRYGAIPLPTVTLHVGLGTFRPVEKEDLRGLELHSEWVEVSASLVEAVRACRARGGRVIAIGTTTVRSLEGVAALHGGRLVPHTGAVNLVIQPGFRFAVVEGLLTNFHLPRSSLLLLVSALIGRRRLLTLYQEAIDRHYRFFSYGDAMWIPPGAILGPGGSAGRVSG
jgi:S-adenosylmethionine:tRNA ribosyltransferase-isomerase